MQTITVDMTPGFRQPTIHYSQNDVGTTFAIDLRSRFGDTLPASPTVKIQATKPSGFGFSIEADSVVGSVATFTTVDTMTDEAGRFQAELQIIKDAVVIYTANFYMEGEANPHPIGTTDGSQETIIPTLTLLVERVEAAAASVLDMTVEAETLAAGSQATYSYDEDTNTATFGIPQGEAGAGAAGVTASAYSSSKTYAVGDYAIHNSNLYRCTTAITTAESFTAAHWTQVVLGDDVTDLKSAIAKIADIGVCPNLVNPNLTQSGFINSDGTISADASWHYSDFIPLEAGKYTMRAVSYVVTYDSSKVFAHRYATNTTGTKTLTFTGSEGVYMRVESNKDVTTWRLNKGETLVDEDWFADYVDLEENVNIDDHLDSTLTDTHKGANAKTVGDYLKGTGLFASLFKKYDYDVYNSDLLGWYEGQNESYDGRWGSDNTPTGDGFGGYTTYAHIISKFDTLMSQSNGYITKNSLGTASGTDSGGNQYTLYEYVLKPKHYSVENPATLTLKVPKILFTCCQHGFEKNIAYGAYYWIYDLVHNWDKSERLNFIRHHVEIRIIPVVNPWGFDNRSYLNANGVNLNRNYDVTGWIYYPTTDPVDSSGAAPFDQPETQIVRDWVDDNNDALVLIDGHTNGQYYASGYNNMNALMMFNDTDDWYVNKMFRVFVREIENQTAMLPKMYPEITPDNGNTATSFCGRTQDGTRGTNNKGTVDLWCIESMNMISFTLETFNGLSVNSEEILSYISPDCKKISSEMIGNCVAEIIREYASI